MDGIFAYQKYQFGYILENVSIPYGHLVNLRSFGKFTVIWYTYVVVIWYISSSFGMPYQEKSGNPG
jgi:hypothetical protein